jgi:hypothetical protein
MRDASRKSLRISRDVELGFMNLDIKPGQSHGQGLRIRRFIVSENREQEENYDPYS